MIYYKSAHKTTPKSISTSWQRNKNTKFIHSMDLIKSIISLPLALEITFLKFPVELHMIDFNDTQFLRSKVNQPSSNNRNKSLFGKYFQNIEKTQILITSQGKISPRWTHYRENKHNLNIQNIMRTTHISNTHIQILLTHSSSITFKRVLYNFQAPVY